MIRVAGGVLLAMAALAAVGGAVLVVLLHIGFSPVLSPSMSPTFDAGDLVVTRQVATGDIRVGDVVVLPRPDADGERYAHRVVQLDEGNVVVTKGDNNPAADPQKLRITSADVPLVIGHVPSIGRFALLGQHVWLRIAVILLVGGCVLVGAKRLVLDR